METPTPELEGRHIEDLVGWAVELQSALESCNVDKASLRQWHKSELNAEVRPP